MIIDLQKFISNERVYWNELQGILDRKEADPVGKMDISGIKRFHYLYQRVSSDLGKIMTFSYEPEIHQYLESLVSRSYGFIHKVEYTPLRIRPIHRFFTKFPIVFRRYLNIFFLSFAITMAGSLFGVAAVTFDPSAKDVIFPFEHIKSDPKVRVQNEESSSYKRLNESKASFSAMLMTHNIRVSIFVFSLGMTYGIGTIILLFYNGVILGAVFADYLISGEGAFLLGWLLPHGVIEIPAILIAGQAGLVLASALIGWGDRLTIAMRVRKIFSDLVILIFGLSIMLVWAGFIEAFFSQYHKPVIPYELKIGVGIIELFLLIFFLSWKKSGNEQK